LQRGKNKAIAADLESQDIILSANGVAGNNDWEYNAAKNEGWGLVKRLIGLRAVVSEKWWCTYVKGGEKSLIVGALPGETSKNGNYSSSFTKWHYQ
jgi:hypothetical protein